MRSKVPIAAGFKIAKGVLLAAMIVVVYGLAGWALGALAGSVLGIVLNTLSLSTTVSDRSVFDVSLGTTVVGACTGATLGISRALRLVICHAREEITRLESEPCDGE